MGRLISHIIYGMLRSLESTIKSINIICLPATNATKMSQWQNSIGHVEKVKCNPTGFAEKERGSDYLRMA